MRPYKGSVHYDSTDMRTEPESQRPEALPKGLVLFRPGTGPDRRRRRLAFLAVYLVVAALLVWPIYPLFSGIRPLILGLPLSLAWVVSALSVMFAALLWLYRSEDRD